MITSDNEFHNLIHLAMEKVMVKSYQMGHNPIKQAFGVYEPGPTETELCSHGK